MFYTTLYTKIEYNKEIKVFKNQTTSFNTSGVTKLKKTPQPGTYFNYFIKSGLKKKTFLFFTISLGWLFFFNNFILGGFVFKVRSLYLKMLDLFNNKLSYNKLQLILKNVKLSRKIRKYTKNKVRYRSYLYVLKKRQFVGYSLRLWKAIYLADLSLETLDFNNKENEKEVGFEDSVTSKVTVEDKEGIKLGEDETFQNPLIEKIVNSSIKKFLITDLIWFNLSEENYSVDRYSVQLNMLEEFLNKSKKLK